MPTEQLSRHICFEYFPSAGLVPSACRGLRFTSRKDRKPFDPPRNHSKLLTELYVGIKKCWNGRASRKDFHKLFSRLHCTQDEAVVQSSDTIATFLGCLRNLEIFGVKIKNQILKKYVSRDLANSSNQTVRKKSRQKV